MLEADIAIMMKRLRKLQDEQQKVRDADASGKIFEEKTPTPQN